MTERGRHDLRREAARLTIGASGLAWNGESLKISVNETTAPVPQRLVGEITIRPRSLSSRRFLLDARGRHRWQPIGPLSDVSVTFEAPKLTWTGTGYFDTNDGDEPLEDAFHSWTWSRYDMGDGARIFYDVTERDGSARGLSLSLRDGAVQDAAPLPYHSLPTTLWGIPRATPGDAATRPHVLQTMENAPFYARSAVHSHIDGIAASGVQETLLLDRLTSPPVRFMVPFRMFRRARRNAAASA